MAGLNWRAPSTEMAHFCVPLLFAVPSSNSQNGDTFYVRTEVVEQWKGTHIFAKIGMLLRRTAHTNVAKTGGCLIELTAAKMANGFWLFVLRGEEFALECCWADVLRRWEDLCRKIARMGMDGIYAQLATASTNLEAKD